MNVELRRALNIKEKEYGEKKQKIRKRKRKFKSMYIKKESEEWDCVRACVHVRVRVVCVCARVYGSACARVCEHSYI